MKRPRRAAKKTVRKAARKTIKRAAKRSRPIRKSHAAGGRGVDPFEIKESLIPVGWAYQWKVKGADVPAGWYCVPYSRHAHDFPRSANYQGAIVIKGLILMEALKDQVASELYYPTKAPIETEEWFKKQFGLEANRSGGGYSYPLLPESEVVTKILKDAPPENGPDIDVPISLLLRVPARWATAAAYLNLTVSEYTRRRVVGERMVLGSMDEREGNLDAVYQPVTLKFSPSKEG